MYMYAHKVNLCKYVVIVDCSFDKYIKEYEFAQPVNLSMTRKSHTPLMTTQIEPHSAVRYSKSSHPAVGDTVPPVLPTGTKVVPHSKKSVAPSSLVITSVSGLMLPPRSQVKGFEKTTSRQNIAQGFSK